MSLLWAQKRGKQRIKLLLILQFQKCGGFIKKKDPCLHLLKMTYVPNNVNVTLHTIFDQPAQVFSEMFPLETDAYITEEN